MPRLDETFMQGLLGWSLWCIIALFFNC